MFPPPPTLRGIAREILRAAAANIVERLGGEPASALVALEEELQSSERACADLREQLRAANDPAKIRSLEALARADAERIKRLSDTLAQEVELRLSRAVSLDALNTAIAERDEARSEREALHARVAELQSGEPAMHAVSIQGRIVASFVVRETAERMAKGSYCEYSIEPLYRSQLAAYGVEGDTFVCWASDRNICLWLEGRKRDTGTREEAEACAKDVEGAQVMRLVAADAPVVKVQDLREIARALIDNADIIGPSGVASLGRQVLIAILETAGH